MSRSYLPRVYKSTSKPKFVYNQLTSRVILGNILVRGAIDSPSETPSRGKDEEMTAMQTLKAENAFTAAILAAIESAVKAGLDAEQIKAILDHAGEVVENNGTE